MIIDLTSMMFNVNVESGGGTPSWGTALGQGQEHKLNYTFGDEFYAGLIYSLVPNINDVTCPLGKGGAIVKVGEPNEKFSIDLASLFNKVYVNDNLIEGASFMLLITREYESVHSGRRTLKYNTKITYRGISVNEDCVAKIRNYLNLNEKSAWMVYEINIVNQDELHFSILVLNKDNEIKYPNSSLRSETINQLIKIDKSIKISINSVEEQFKEFLKIINEDSDRVKNSYPTSLKSEKLINKLKLVNKNFNYNSFYDILDYQIIKNLYGYIKTLSQSIKESDDVKKFFDGVPYIEDYTLSSALKYYMIFLALYYRVNNKDRNIIFYGVPGVGKSYKIKQEGGLFVQEKTVFHPEYTNADFVGQLLPVRNGENETDASKSQISYEFVPGPFTRILEKALKNKDNADKKYMLVIDEINRGNASAIFGEIFQLLDRDEDGKSEFSINNKDIYDYLTEKAGVDKSLLPDEKIYLPSNLYIWATMNTSDQNVYTLDTAFQRRWQMEMLVIDFDKDDDTKVQGEIVISNSKNDLHWREFVTAINKKISDNNEGMISVEDKRIGPWFAKRNEIENIDLFTQKVIKYLWDDAFKMSRADIFKDVKTLDDIVVKIGKGNNIEDIFKDGFFDEVIKNRKVTGEDEKVESSDNENVEQNE